MASYVTEAILLAVRNWGEADKMVTFFSRDLGKIRAVAYGCRRPRSPLAGGMQMFSHLELHLQEGAGLDTVRQCETKTAFRSLRENLESMAYALFIAELVAELCPERHPEPEVYDLLLAALQMMESRNPRLVALAAAFQILEHTGCQPQYDFCMSCGSALTDGAAFSAARGGALCVACKDGDALDFPEDARRLVRNLLTVRWDAPVSFVVGGGALVRTERLLLAYLLFVIEKPLKSLSFIGELSALAARPQSNV